MAQIAIIGYGVVGGGITKVIDTNRDKMKKALGQDVEVKYILDLRDFPGDPYEKKVVHDLDIILADPEVSVICETMGGNEPAFTFTKRALAAGKSVCTSNKELVANHGPELLELAKANNCSYLFEASCGGGIPIIRPINTNLVPDDIIGITGILNGTTNYILTKMDKEGAAFDDVLKQAQDLGYAERNPEADVEGYDPGRKIAILGSLMCGKTISYEDVYTEGITKITADDFACAKAYGATIKILAQCKKTDLGVQAMVSPCVVSLSHPLAGVNEVFNSIYVESNMLGETMYYGKGAGRDATASAVVSDVVEAIRNQGHTTPIVWSGEKVELASLDDSVRKFMVRVLAEDATVAKEIFAVSEVIDTSLDNMFVFITEEMTEKAFAACAEKVNVISRIRLFA